MKAKKPLSFSPGALICAILGHRYEVSRNITEHIKEYRCSCCAQEMTDTAQGFMAKLTPKFKETNAYLERYYKRRCSRKVYIQESFSEAS